MPSATPDSPVRVLIADDHPPIRAGIREVLKDSGFEVCAEVGTGREAVDTAVDTEPHICLLDLHMPGGDGVEAARSILGQLSGTVVVMLTVARSDEHLFAALEAGAAGYLPKDIDPDRLPDALWGVLRGEAALPRMLVARVLEQMRTRKTRRLTLPNGRQVTLTGREWEVMEGLCDGLSTREVADRLTVSAVTVRTHVAAALRKLRVPDRAAAVRLLKEER